MPPTKGFWISIFRLGSFVYETRSSNERENRIRDEREQLNPTENRPFPCRLVTRGSYVRDR